MQIDKIPLNQTGSFSKIFLDYLDEKPELKNFYENFPRIENFQKQIDLKSGFSPEIRNDLATTLSLQYNNGGLDESLALTQIESLRDSKTFTVTTGHQLNLFTGPLYFILKISTVINACKELKTKYPDYNFVPVYWMATEDHDFEEIQHFRLFGKKHVWESDQKGAVGRFNTAGIQTMLDELPEHVEFIENAYLTSATLADAMRRIVDHLFGKHGLVIVDADAASLKKHFAKAAQNDLEGWSAKLLKVQNEKIEEIGYKVQVNGRPINLFYLEDGLRERLEQSENADAYSIVNTDRNISADEAKSLLTDHPERFSPNVILRPLYQEMILPNLAYVGGPSELAYWLQLKLIFEDAKVPFPMLMPRNYGLILNGGVEKKRNKLGLSHVDLFKDNGVLKDQFLAATEGEFNLSPEREALAKVFDEIKTKAVALDGSLSGWVMSEASKSFKSLDNIEKRLKKTEENKHATQINQIEGFKEKLFPGGTLQERKENFLNFYLNHTTFVDELVENLDPFDFQMNIITI